MSYDIMFNQALSLHEAGKIDEAERIYRQILETAPKHAEVLNLLGLIAQAKGAQTEACDLFYRAIKEASDRAPFYYNLAFSFKLDGKPHEAIENFEKALALQPEIKEAFNEIGNMYKEINNIEKARDNWKKAISLDSSFAEAKANLALSYEQENINLAIEKLEEISKSYDSEALIWFYLSRLYIKTKQIDKAWQAASRAKELAPMSDEVRVVLGQLSFAEQKIDNARIYFEKAVLLNPLNKAALSGLAAIYTIDNDFEAAEAKYKRLIELDAGDFEVHNNYAEMLYRQKRIAEALEEYRQAVILNPYSAEVSNNLGLILKDNGDLEQAAGLFINAYTLKPELEEFSINLAETLTLLHQEDSKKAVEIAEYWQVRAPDNIFAKHVINAFRGEENENNSEYSERLFEHFADNYELVVKNLGYSAPLAVGRIAGSLENSIVDLGCGTGLVGEVIKSTKNHLTGVDISEKMLKKAEEKHVYDNLIHCDIIKFLQNNHHFEWAVAADVLGYLGDLRGFFEAAKGIKLIFTIEKYNGSEDYKLMPCGRYQHNPLYIDRLLKENGYNNIYYENIILRNENDKKVEAVIWKAE